MIKSKSPVCEICSNVAVTSQTIKVLATECD